jgi:membrane fusion protein (multidrug efflux system)
VTPGVARVPSWKDPTMYLDPYSPSRPTMAVRRARWLPAAFACGAIVLAAAGCKQKTDQAAAQAQHQPVTVSVVKVAKRPIHPSESFIGRVEAIRVVDLVARVSGFVEKQNYTDGQEVKAGALLFTLEKDTYQAAVDAAKATLAQAQANAANAKLQVGRARRLVRNGNIPVATVDDRETALKQADAAIQGARAQLDQAQINLGYTEVRAPFDGRVGRANFKLGALVGPNTGPLATIVSQDPMYVTFPVSDRLAMDFRSRKASTDPAYDGVRVRIFLSNGQEFPFSGKIDFTDVRVDRGTDTLLVRAVLSNPDRLLVDGQYVRVEAEQRNPVEALVVPQRAILTDQSGTSVYVVGPDNKVAQKHVTTGQVVGTDTVVQGLSENELVVVDGLQTLRPGVPVAAQVAAVGGAAGAGAPPGGADSAASGGAKPNLRGT